MFSETHDVENDNTADGTQVYRTDGTGDDLASNGFWNLYMNTQQHQTIGSSPWKVINYQIPVPIGDCSAHFLVEKDSNKVHRAFLMDGGTNAGSYVAWAQILKGLRFVDLQLGNTWRFDSWIVTHWDADHYRGVKDLLLNEDIEFTRCKRNGDTITRGNPGSFKSLYLANNAWLCCGAWDVEAMFKEGEDFLRHFVRKGKCDLWKSMLLDRTWKGTKAQALLRCLWGETLIGMDLFTRSYQYIRETGIEYKHLFGSPDFGLRLESDTNPIAAENTPRFCVVGANGFGIGESDDPSRKKPTRNETSILAILYWKGQNLCSYYTGGDGSPALVKGPVQTWLDRTWPNGNVEMVKLDHHGSTRENLGGAHLTRSKIESNLEEEKQQSESGSESESESKREGQKGPPADLDDIGLIIEDMKPRRVLVTPGSSHGHPTWDVMIFLRDYFERLSDASGSQKGNPDKDPHFDTTSARQEEEARIRQEAQERFQKAREAYVNYICDKDKNAPQKHQDRKGNSTNRYKFWIGKNPNKLKRNSPALKTVKAQKELAALWRNKEELDKMTPEDIEILKDELAKITVEEQEPAIDEEVSTAEDAVEAARRLELCEASAEWKEANDDAQLEGVEDFEAICWQPLTASETEDPHFLIRFDFTDQRGTTAVQVFDDNGQFQYVKKPQVPDGSGQHEEVKAASPTMPKGSWRDRPVQIVEQSAAERMKLLVEDDQNPWIRYAYSECAIATMLSDDYLRATFQPKQSARAKKSSGKKTISKGEPKNMVFKYYTKRKSADEGIQELLRMAEVDEVMGDDR
ncbi:hypothetical protein MKX07_006618 [Trichoderma sp. CBMAI-0711]|nr:hypothetical protein MKX07_006618 [Trichoderma sp. CBMAI-0711]